MNVASRTTSKKFAAGDLTLNVESGRPVHIYGMEFNNRSAAVGGRVFTINEADGTFIGELNLPTLTHDEWAVPFIADKGIQIVCNGADGSVVVFHNNPGR